MSLTNSQFTEILNALWKSLYVQKANLAILAMSFTMTTLRKRPVTLNPIKL